MRAIVRRAALTFTALLVAVAARSAAQPAARFVGHWIGSISLPRQTAAFDIDLRTVSGGYAGDISIPSQNAKDLPLARLVIQGDSIRFVIEGVPGEPTFRGTLAPGGKAIAGILTQGANSFPFTLAPGPTPAEAARAALGGFDRFVDSAMASWKVAGLGLGIVVDGEVVYARGHGLRDQERKLPATSKTLFAIGSSSKAFTTFALGSLVDQGKLEWDKPLLSYMPDFRLYDASATLRITPRDLVTHRSGLPRHDLVWYNNTSSTRDEVVRRLAFLPPNKDLREVFQYNNLMFLTAGVLAGRLMNSSWEDAIRRLVFEPVGMAGSNFSVAESQRSGDFSYGYRVDKDTIRSMPFRNIDLVGPAGSINSNVDDMLRWVSMHLAGGVVQGKPLLSRATLTDMYAPHMSIGGSPGDRDLGAQNYGLGWFLVSYRGQFVAHHGGNIDGFSAMVALLPQRNIGMVILSNQNSSALPGLLRNHAIDRLLALSPRDWNGEALANASRGRAVAEAAAQKKESLRVPGTRPSHAPAAYAAEYAHPGYGVLSIAPQGERLVATYNAISTTLEHWHYDVFNGLRNPADPTFADMKYNFRGNLKGDIESVVVAFEPNVEPLVFLRQPDRRLTDAAYLERFVGSYASASDSASIRIQGTSLVLGRRGQPVITLIPDRGAEFNLKGLAGYSIEFVDDPRGAVTEMRSKQPNGVFVFRRVAP